MSTDTETDFPHTTADVAVKLGVAPITVRRRARAIGIGIDIGGTAGVRYSNADVQRLVESMRPAPVVKQPRKRKRRTTGPVTA